MEGEVKQEMGIEQVLELLDAVKKLAVAGIKIGADGKINTGDLMEVVALAKDADSIIEGFKDLDVAMKQLKDVDEMEAAQLVAKGFEIAKAIKSAKEAV